MRIELILFILVVLIYFIVQSVDYIRAKKREGKIVHKWDEKLAQIFEIMMLFVILLEYFTLKRNINLIITIGGATVTLLLLYAFFAARKSLGEYFSPYIKIIKDHRLIKTGIYSKIRHPIYLLFLLISISLPLILNAYYSTIIAFIGAAIYLTFRIKAEEKVLLKHFGKEYEDYMKETSRFIPKLWNKK